MWAGEMNDASNLLSMDCGNAEKVSFHLPSEWFANHYSTRYLDNAWDDDGCCIRPPAELLAKIWESILSQLLGAIKKTGRRYDTMILVELKFLVHCFSYRTPFSSYVKLFRERKHWGPREESRHKETLNASFITVNSNGDKRDGHRTSYTIEREKKQTQAK